MRKESEVKQLFNISFKEAKFDDDKKTATVTIIKQGWSKNRTHGKLRYYAEKAVKDVVGLLQELESKKMYDNHSDLDRKNQEWVATVEDSWFEDNSAKAKIVFTNNPATSWMYEEAKYHPALVGISIDGMGRWQEGTVDGKEALIITDMKTLESADFVTKPAAGGRVDVAENEQHDRLSEAIKTLNDRIADNKKQSMPYIELDMLMSAVSEFVSGCAWSEDFEETDIATMVGEFESNLKKIINDIRGNVEENAMDLKQFQKENPDAYVNLMEQASIVKEVEIEKSYKDKVDKAEKELSESQKKVTELDTELKTVKEEVMNLKKDLSAYKEKEKIEKRKEFIVTKLVEAKIDKDVSKEFMEILEAEEDDVKIEKLIKERESVINSFKNKINLPQNKDDGNTNVKVRNEQDKINEFFI